MLEQLIDAIYEAAVVVERWPRVLEALTGLGEGAGASFVSGGGQQPLRWAATPVIEALIAEFTRQPYENPRIAIALNAREPCFQSDLDIMSRERIETDPFFAEFMRPRGFGWCIGSVFFAPGADPIVFSVERRFESGPPPRHILDFFDGLRPHLARAALLSVRLGLDRARAKAEALAAVGYPAAVLNARGQAITMNDLLSRLCPEFVADRKRRLVFADPQADRLFVGAMHGQNLTSLRAGVQSFPLQDREASRVAVAHLLPIRGAAHDLFSPAASLLFITPVAAGAGPDVKLLEALFDLTPAEARVARGIAEARTLDAIAGGLNLSKETVRAQLKAVFAKTGVGRQVELIRLLAGVPLPSAARMS